MRFTSYIALALPLASVVCGEVSEGLFRSRIARSVLPRSATSVKNMKALSVQDVLIESTPVDTGKNRTISFAVADPNSNSTTNCFSTYIDTNSTSTRPTSYISCATSNASFEHWQWYFETYTSLEAFTFRIDHTFTDDAVGLAPYNKLSLFSRANISLTCDDGDSCSMTSTDNSAPANVWGLSA